MTNLLQDGKHTVRRLFRSPGFTMAVVVTLALGIGANTAIFALINSILLKPLPFPEPDRLVGVWQTAPGVNIRDLNACLADYVTYREHSNTFADVGVWNSRSFTVTEFSDPERVDGIFTTFRTLPMLGLNPILGRALTEQDSIPNNPEVILISHAYWQRRFGGDPKVVGRRIESDGVKREIIGVLPENSWFLDAKHDIVIPLRYDRANVRLAGYNFRAIARLRPGVTLAEANADVARMIAIEFTKFPPPNGISLKMMEDARLAPNVRMLKEELLGDIGKSLWVVMATIGIVLLIACANVANLLLVRADGRGQELAVRAALGAGAGRLARELLTESLLLALAGGALGVAFATAVVRLVVTKSPTRLPRLELISIDGTTLFFTLALSVIAGLGFGAIPVLRWLRTGVAATLRAGGRTASSSRSRNVTRNTLTVIQVALALVLLVGSGLMIRTFQSMRRVPPGFQQPESLQTLRVSIPRSAAPKDPDLRQMQKNLAGKLSTIPGVSEVGMFGGLPMTGVSSQDPIIASDRTYPPNQIPTLRRFFSSGPGGFHALGVPILAGREFTWNEIVDGRRVVIIGENFAREYWASPRAAIGKQIRSNPNDPWSEIVGVVADIRHDGVEQKAPSSVYWPILSQNSVTFLVRSPRAGSEGLANELRQAVWSVNPSLPVTEMRTMREIYERSMSRTAFLLTLLAISGGMALLLAVVGVYAVISYTVAQRQREIGIRLALGAQQSALKLLFVRHGLTWGGIGAAVGLLVAAGLSQGMSAVLFDISPMDPATYFFVVIGILTAAAFASYLPARRVVQVDPVEALRSE